MTLRDPKPIKKLGQNWLVDTSVIQKMVKATEIRPTDLIVEIGPGTGAITRVLAKEADEIVAYEIDQDLVANLKEELHWAKNVTIVEQNILAKEFLLPSRNYKVIGSLPYYITSPILEKLLTATPLASIIVLMVQMEVAEKICSLPPDGSYLSNFVHLFGEPEIVAQVGPTAFFPQPKVESAIMRIKTTPKLDIPHFEIEQLQQLLHAGFSEPRKKLHNSLSSGLGTGLVQTKTLISLANIDSERRPETLSLPEWVKLYQVIKNA